MPKKNAIQIDTPLVACKNDKYQVILDVESGEIYFSLRGYSNTAKISWCDFYLRVLDANNIEKAEKKLVLDPEEGLEYHEIYPWEVFLNWIFEDNWELAKEIAGLGFKMTIYQEFGFVPGSKAQLNWDIETEIGVAYMVRDFY